MLKLSVCQLSLLKVTSLKKARYNKFELAKIQNIKKTIKIFNDFILSKLLSYKYKIIGINK